MITRLAYSGGLIVLGAAMFSLDILGFILGVYQWDRLLKGGLAAVVFVLLTLVLRRTMSKPPRALIRELNRLVKQRKGSGLLHTDDALIHVKRFPLPVFGVAVIGVVNKEMLDDAMSDLNVGHRITAMSADVYTIQGKGLISHEMKAVEVTGTIDNPHFDVPTDRRGLAKAVLRVLWQGIRSLPFDLRTGNGRVTDNEARYVAEQLATAQPVRIEDHE